MAQEGLVLARLDNRPATIDVGQGMEWRLTLVKKFRCIRCPKVILGKQDYRLYMKDEEQRVHDLEEGYCDECHRWLMD